MRICWDRGRVGILSRAAEPYDDIFSTSFKYTTMGSRSINETGINKGDLLWLGYKGFAQLEEEHVEV